MSESLTISIKSVISQSELELAAHSVCAIIYLCVPYSEDAKFSHVSMINLQP